MTCGSGMRTRTVRCIDPATKQDIDTRNCIEETRPATVVECRTGVQCPEGGGTTFCMCTYVCMFLHV